MAYNPYLVVPLATWAVTQIAKFAIAAFRGRIDFRYLYASGGMPSVHSAVVSSLATTAFLIDGSGSHLFGFTLIFAAVVMYDSFGVRRSSGEQAAAINSLVSSLEANRVKLEQPNLHVREILGHQPKEVIVGALSGVVLACLFSYDRLGVLGTFMQTTPKRIELIAYLAAFIIIMLGGLIARFALRAKYRKSATMKRLASQILAASQTISWLGLATVILNYEHASYFAWRFWPILILAVGLTWAFVLATASYKKVPESLATEADVARKRKWLTWGSKRRKSKRG